MSQREFNRLLVWLLGGFALIIFNPFLDVVGVGGFGFLGEVCVLIVYWVRGLWFPATYQTLRASTLYKYCSRGRRAVASRRG